MHKFNYLHLKSISNEQGNVKLGKIESIIFSPILIIIDQIVFPMFRIGPLSFKISYFLLPLFFLLYIVQQGGNLKVNRTVLHMIMPIVIISFIGLVGQIYLASFGTILNHYDAIKQEMTFFLIVFGVFLGYYQRGKLNFRWLIIALYFYLFIVVILSLFPYQFKFIAKLWWGSLSGIDEKLQSFNIRPTPFGDGSMVGANILFLFIVVSIKNKWLKTTKLNQVFLSIFTILVAIILQGRNQIVLTIVLVLSLFTSSNLSFKSKVKSTIFIFLIILIIFLIFDYSMELVPQLEYALIRIEKTTLLSTESNEISQSVLLRPFRTLERSFDRFIQSPIWGSGFSVLNVYPFERLNPHNDIFYILITSGIIGVIFYILWVVRILKYSQWIMILPFIAPGLTNSFITSVGSVVAYSVFLGIYLNNNIRKNSFYSM